MTTNIDDLNNNQIQEIAYTRTLEQVSQIINTVAQQMDISETSCTCDHGEHDHKNNFDQYRAFGLLQGAMKRIEQARGFINISLGEQKQKT